MSGVISDYMRRELLKRGFQPEYTLPFSQFEVALTRRLPLANSAVAQLDEPIGGGYRRSNVVTMNATNLPLRVTDGLIYNATPISWPLDCTVAWGTITGWAVISIHATAPRVLAVGDVIKPVRFIPGQRPYLPANSIAFELSD